MATNFFNNSQHVNISLITLKVSAVCTVQDYPNVIKFHEAKLRLSQNKVVHEQKDKECQKISLIFQIQVQLRQAPSTISLLSYDI